MSVFTRDKLNQLYLDNKIYVHQQMINKLSNEIKLIIIDKNRHGDKMYEARFSNKKLNNNSVRYIGEDAIIILNAVVDKLKEIFTDSDITLETNDITNMMKLTINWKI
jgi:hypothetical protein